MKMSEYYKKFKQCDRCGREFSVEVVEGDNLPDKDSSNGACKILYMEYDNKKIEYFDLCDSCKKTLNKYFQSMDKIKRPKKK